MANQHLSINHMLHHAQHSIPYFSFLHFGLNVFLLSLHNWSHDFKKKYFVKDILGIINDGLKYGLQHLHTIGYDGTIELLFLYCSCTRCSASS